MGCAALEVLGGGSGCAAVEVPKGGAVCPC